MSKKGFELNTKRIHKDILQRLNELNKPQRFLTTEKVISRSTFNRLGQGKDITMNSYLRIIYWLDKEAGYYIRYER